MSTRSDRIYILISAGLALFYFGYYILTMDWVNGGGDSYNHFLFARYAPQHPELLLHHWAKPLYTLLLVPFAQTSIKGAEFFNLFLLLGCGYLVYRMAKILGYRSAWLAMGMVLLTPIVYINLFSALTEPLGAFILTLGMYGLISKRWILGAVVLSFLPVVRTETFIFFPLWAAYLLVERKWKILPFLATGFLVYSLVGWGYYDDFLWLIHQNPYKGAADIYNHGELLHFVNEYRHITHVPLGILLLIGIGGSLPWKGKESFYRPNFWQECLVIAVAAAYFSAHSYVWWKGIGGSAGLLRVMLVIAPLLVLLAIKGFTVLTSWLKNERFVGGFGLVILAFMFYICQERYRLPQQLHPEDALVHSLLDRSKQWKTTENRVFYAHPVIPYFMNLNPYDKSQTMNLIENGGWMLGEMQPGDVFIWDSHFCPNEVRLTEELIANKFGLYQTEQYKSTWEPDGQFEIRIYRKQP